MCQNLDLQFLLFYCLFVKVFSAPFHFFDLAIYCLFFFFLFDLYRPLFFSLLFHFCFVHVFFDSCGSSLTYLNSTKMLGCCCCDYYCNELPIYQDELLFQVTLLSRIQHRHLVAFLGYSQQDGKNILVYEFMHKGTLKEHLRGKCLSCSW
jgi:hypothetical protein